MSKHEKYYEINIWKIITTIIAILTLLVGFSYNYSIITDSAIQQQVIALWDIKYILLAIFFLLWGRSN